MALIKKLTSGKLGVEVYDTRDEMGKAAAGKAEECLKALLASKDEVNVIFAAAPSQNETLRYLAEAEGIDWTRVNAFHMDEYVGLPEGAPQAFGKYLFDHIFGLKPFKSVNYISGRAQDSAAECARYTELLEKYPTDMVCLGIGENGHIAFNDPWEADFNDPAMVKVVNLDPVCRNQQVNDGCFATIDDVPKQAFSLTIPALTKAAHLVCTVPAATKTQAVTKTVNDEISENVPATIMRLHDDAVMYCDRDSGAGLI